jgi:uncharacterized membrane protein YkvA (DUF1232 family)
MADPFPRHEAAGLIRRLPTYGRLAWRLANDPAVPASRRGALIAAAVYLASPIDVVPGIIPVVGQLDDLIVVVAALRFAMAGMPPQQRQAQLEMLGLSEATVASDERALADIGAWTLRAVARTGAWTARAAGRTGVRIARVGVVGVGRLARHGAPDHAAE